MQSLNQLKMGEKNSDKVFIFAGRATENLARRVADIYGIPLGNSTVFQYADGEFQPSYEETIRGGIVFIIQSTTPPTDNLFELLMMIDAAKRASAEKIIAVIPYYGFARQDRKDKPHVPIASKLIADMITARSRGAEGGAWNFAAFPEPDIPQGKKNPPGLTAD